MKEVDLDNCNLPPLLPDCFYLFFLSLSTIEHNVPLLLNQAYILCQSFLLYFILFSTFSEKSLWHPAAGIVGSISVIKVIILTFIMFNCQVQIYCFICLCLDELPDIGYHKKILLPLEKLHRCFSWLAGLN